MQDRPSLPVAMPGASLAWEAEHSGPDRLRAMILGEIANYPLLRRQLGTARASGLIADICARAGAILTGSAVTPVARTGFETGRMLRSASELRALLGALTADMAGPIDIDGEPCVVQMRFAAALAPAADHDEIQLAEAAEAALGRVRAGDGDGIIDLSKPDALLDRAQLQAELPAAIAAGEMFLHYQPKIHLRQRRIASAEALVRWQHPQRGLIAPGDFIGAAEESGAIGALTIWTLHRVIADQRRLRTHGHDFAVFINISGQLLADRQFVDMACMLVRNSGATIGFEITETSVIRDPASAIAHLHAFAEIGIPLAIDDYGAGLSSLSYLKQLPAKELKIDKLFVTQLTSSNRDPLIVRSTIDLAHALDMEVTAEGVETPAALALLSVMGCDMAQGYLLSRPIGIDAFERYCDEQRHLDVTNCARPTFGGSESFWRRSG